MSQSKSKATTVPEPELLLRLYDDQSKLVSEIVETGRRMPNKVLDLIENHRKSAGWAEYGSSEGWHSGAIQWLTDDTAYNTSTMRQASVSANDLKNEEGEKTWWVESYGINLPPTLYRTKRQPKFISNMVTNFSAVKLRTPLLWMSFRPFDENVKASYTGLGLTEPIGKTLTQSGDLSVPGAETTEANESQPSQYMIASTGSQHPGSRGRVWRRKRGGQRHKPKTDSTASDPSAPPSLESARGKLRKVSEAATSPTPSSTSTTTTSASGIPFRPDSFSPYTASIASDASTPGGSPRPKPRVRLPPPTLPILSEYDTAAPHGSTQAIPKRDTDILGSMPIEEAKQLRDMLEAHIKTKESTSSRLGKADRAMVYGGAASPPGSTTPTASEPASIDERPLFRIILNPNDPESEVYQTCITQTWDPEAGKKLMKTVFGDKSRWTSETPNFAIERAESVQHIESKVLDTRTEGEESDWEMRMTVTVSKPGQEERWRTSISGASDEQVLGSEERVMRGSQWKVRRRPGFINRFLNSQVGTGDMAVVKMLSCQRKGPFDAEPETEG